ncbi:MAG TPA: transglycosylase family protein [Solirubrobacterales bacterium]
MRRISATSLLVLVLAAGASARAADIGTLQGRVGRAQAEAGELASEIRSTQEQLASAQQRADAAAAREDRLSALLATGEERAARLASAVERTRHHLEVERARLRRARRALAQRLVAVYMSGSPDTASVILASSDLDELATRTEYLERIQSSDNALAERVKDVRDEVRHGLERVAALKARVDRYNERLAAAREEIASVRSRAEASSATLASLRSARESSLSELKTKIGQWVSEIEAAEAASRAAAEETVGRWLGGPYAIPTYIVICESGGDYGAVNPSSGAGGAYQILPSTWALYGGQGAPQEASKEEQDRIAGEIWADSGSGAWACG